MPELRGNFREVIRRYTAGDPQREEVTWTNLAKTEIAERLAKTSTPVSVNIVTQLLDDADFHRRKLRKTLAMGSVPRRNDQFERIAELLDEYEQSPNPILSMDSKKKEALGPYFRPGLLFSAFEVPVYDHDFLHASRGVLLPHGLYDPKRNIGHLYLGLSHDTSQFACDNVYRWWMRFGRWYYPSASSLLLLCDCGGSNDYRRYLFKEELQKLADRMQLQVRVAHYPPYTSKYNPIEHRLFPHVTRACAGVSFEDLATVVQLMRKTRTRTGLRVTVEVVRNYYATGLPYSAEFRDSMPLVFDDDLSDWNYTAVPGAAADVMRN
jgi:Rhodopirellula transposase DDE domain